MDNNKFLQSLIDATKRKTIEWYLVDTASARKFKFYYDYAVYAVKRNDTILVLQKYKYASDSVSPFEESYEIGAVISICNEDYKQLYQMYEGGFDSGELFRLYSLVERNVNKIDERLEAFINGMDNEQK